MATDRQIAANRANAKKSTGPRTPSGRARSSQNALIHGLSCESTNYPTDADIKAITGRIAGPGADEQVVEATRQLVSAYRQLEQIDRLRRNAFQIIETAGQKPSFSELRRLASLDRYERYALTKVARARSILNK